MDYLLIILVLVGFSFSTTAQTTPYSVPSRNHARHRSNNELLLRLEEKIRGMEAVSYAVKLARMDYVLDQLNRRVETIESQINSLQLKLESKLEKLDEVILSHNRRDEFSSEQIPVKIETMSDKILNKLNLIETKVDMKIDNLSSKFERNERQLLNTVEDILEKLVKGEETQSQLESLIKTYSIKSDNVDIEVNNLQTYIKEEFTEYLSLRLSDIGAKIDSGFQQTEQQHVEKLSKISSDDQMDKILDYLENLPNKSCINRGRSNLSDYHLNPEEMLSKTQITNFTTTMTDALRFGARKFQELDNEMEMYTRKVLNIYQEQLKTSRETEGYLKDVLKLTNQTNVSVRDGFRRFYQRITPFTALRAKMEELLEGVQHKIIDLDVSVDTSFASLLVAQNAFIASCQRIQHQEPQMEHKIYTLLQQLLINQNNSNNTEGVTNTILMSMLKNHNLQVGKALNDLVWTILTADNQSKEEMRKVINQLNALQYESSSSCLIKRGEWDSLIGACSTLNPKQKAKSKLRGKSESMDKIRADDEDESVAPPVKVNQNKKDAGFSDEDSREVMSDDSMRLDKLFPPQNLSKEELNKHTDEDEDEDDYTDEYSDVYIDQK